MSFDSIAKLLFPDRSGDQTVDPIINFTRLKFYQCDDVDYYCDYKEYYSLLAGLSESNAVSLMIEDLTFELKLFFIGHQVKTYQQFRQIVQSGYQRLMKTNEVTSSDEDDDIHIEYIHENCSPPCLLKTPRAPCWKCYIAGRPTQFHWYDHCPFAADREDQSTNDDQAHTPAANQVHQTGDEIDYIQID